MPGGVVLAVIGRHPVQFRRVGAAGQPCQALPQGKAEGVDDGLVLHLPFRDEMVQGLMESGQDQGRGVGQRPVKIK